MIAFNWQSNETGNLLAVHSVGVLIGSSLIIAGNCLFRSATETWVVLSFTQESWL